MTYTYWTIHRQRGYVSVKSSSLGTSVERKGGPYRFPCRHKLVQIFYFVNLRGVSNTIRDPVSELYRTFYSPSAL